MLVTNEEINNAEGELLEANKDLAKANIKVEEANKKDAEMKEQLGKHYTDLETIDNKI